MLMCLQSGEKGQIKFVLWCLDTWAVGPIKNILREWGALDC